MLPNKLTGKSIKVNSCKNPEWWYAKQIGKEFPQLDGLYEYNGVMCHVVTTPKELTHLGVGYINPDDGVIVDQKPVAENKGK